MTATVASLDTFIRGIPKAELHVHLEGTLEPEMTCRLAAKHGVRLAHDSPAALRRAYAFADMQSFLDLYYAGASVLRDEADFHDLTRAYLDRAHADGVVHAEVFFDPQAHTRRGVPFATVVDGIQRALAGGARDLGMSSRLIMCFLRDLGEDAAFATLAEAMPYRGRLAAVGLDSAERGYPPAGFARVFAAVRAAGLPCVAHAGEEGPAAYVREALDLLHAVRIDHGVRSEEDPELCARLVRDGIPLTVCPISNVRLRIFRDDRRSQPEAPAGRALRDRQLRRSRVLRRLRRGELPGRGGGARARSHGCRAAGEELVHCVVPRSERGARVAGADRRVRSLGKGVIGVTSGALLDHSSGGISAQRGGSTDRWWKTRSRRRRPERAP
jgi:adenine deaminase